MQVMQNIANAFENLTQKLATNPDDLSRLAKKYKEIADLPEAFTFHSLRHTHATLLLKAGVFYLKSLSIE